MGRTNVTITDIDKQLERSRLWKEGGNSFECSDYEGICDDMKKLVHQIYSQAKAEQRETDARIAEKGIVRLTNPSQPLVFNELTIYACKLAGNVACEDIAKQIRSGNESRKGK